MFGEISGSLADLTESDRQELAKLTQSSLEYLEKQVEVNRLKLRALQDPSLKNINELNVFSSLVVAPARRTYAENALGVLKGSVDVSQLKSMLPMIAAVLLGSVNVTKILAAFNIDPDSADELISSLKDLLKSGMESTPSIFGL